jgi:hypothetical protein
MTTLPDEGSAPMTVWTTTTPAKDLDYRCDLCGEPADALHFVPWVMDCEEVLFSCSKHDAGGYWVEFKHWFDPEERFPRHVAQKGERDDPGNGGHALFLLGVRQDALRVEAAERARKVEESA